MAPNVGNQRVYQFDGFEADAVERSLRRNGTTISLTPKVFDLLVALLQAYIFTLLSAVFIGLCAHPEH